MLTVSPLQVTFEQWREHLEVRDQLRVSLTEVSARSRGQERSVARPRTLAGVRGKMTLTVLRTDSAGNIGKKKMTIHHHSFQF